MTNANSAGIECGCNVNGQMCGYSQIDSAMGPSFFGVFIKANGVANEFRNFNFINCSSSIGWIEIALLTGPPQFLNCVFHIISSSSIVTYRAGGGGLPSFSICVFSIDYNSKNHSSISTAQNSFGIKSPIYQSISFFPNEQCLSEGFSIPTIRPKMNMKYQYYLIILHQILL